MCNGGEHRFEFRAALLVTACLAASGCGDFEAEETTGSLPASASTPTTGGTAVVGVAAGGTTLLPPLAAAALDFEIGGSLYLALNYAEWEDGALVYREAHSLALARDWTLNNGDASLTYHLNASRRWSDGTPVTAADVEFTYDLLADTTLALPLSSSTERLDSLVVLNDSTVTFFFDRPYPGMLFDTGVSIIPAHVYGSFPREEMGGLPGYDASEGGELVVSGPFQLAEWRPTERIVLVRNEAFADPPHLDRIVFRIMPEETTRLAELRTGGIDLSQVNSFLALRDLLTDSAIDVRRVPQRGYDYIAWHPEGHPALADPLVRRALSSALDRDAMVAALDLTGFGEPAYGPYGSLFPALRTRPPETPAYDPARAARLLDEAGWRDADGAGVREREGRRLEIELATTAGNPRREAAVQIVQSQLAEVGVRANIRVEEFQALLGRVIGRNYESALLGWQVGLDPDISMFWADPDGPFNVVGYDSPETRDLIERAQAQATYDGAAEFWREAGNRIAADHPYTFLWFFDFPIAVGPRLRGVQTSALGFGPSMSSWWIPEAHRR